METQIATALLKGSVSEIAQRWKDVVAKEFGNAPPVLMVVFASPETPLRELAPKLRADWPRTTVLGSSTAGEFTEKGDAKGSVSLFALGGDFQVASGFGANLKANLEEAARQATLDIPPKMADFPHRTGVVLLDTLSGNAEEATLLTSLKLGANLPLAGGAAGDDLKMKHTPVALNGQVANDAIALVVIFSKKPLGIGVQHGQKGLSSLMKVTRSDGNVVYEVNGRNARQVWRDETTEAAKRQGLNPDDLNNPDKATPYLLLYQAGLSVDSDNALKIRAPLTLDDSGALHFACGMPEGVEFRITTSNPEQQIQSAREAARLAKEGLKGAPCAGALVFDCICRYEILGTRFSAAVTSIQEVLAGVPFAGFESYGEIALSTEALSGFHNTTSVVLCFPK